LSEQLVNDFFDPRIIPADSVVIGTSGPATSTALLDQRSPGRRGSEASAHAKPIKQAKRSRSQRTLNEAPTEQALGPVIVPPVPMPARLPFPDPVPADRQYAPSPDLSLPPLNLPPYTIETASLSPPAEQGGYFPCCYPGYWEDWTVIVEPQEGGNPPTPAVPEPANWALMSAGLFAVGGTMRLVRRRARARRFPVRA
jgi:hypothetical protein